MFGKSGDFLHIYPSMNAITHNLFISYESSRDHVWYEHPWNDMFHVECDLEETIIDVWHIVHSCIFPWLLHCWSCNSNESGIFHMLWCYCSRCSPTWYKSCINILVMVVAISVNRSLALSAPLGQWLNARVTTVEIIIRYIALATKQLNDTCWNDRHHGT